MSDRNLYTEELVNSIAADVLTVLKRERFFEYLDDRLCPTDGSRERDVCRSSFEISIGVLRDFGLNSRAVQDVIKVLEANGACCDCEILYNVAEEGRLKSEYWIAHPSSTAPPEPHSRLRES